MDLYISEISNLVQHFQVPQLVFLNVLTCEKVLPIYSLFSEYNSWGKKEALEEAILLQYQYLQTYTFSELEIENTLEDIETVTPDLDMFENGLASYALDSCIIFIESLNFLQTKNMDTVLNVASYARDLVDMFVQEKNDLAPNDNHLELKIQSDVFMKKEIERYHEVIKRIQSLGNISGQNIEEIRTLNLQFGEIISVEILNDLYLD